MLNIYYGDDYADKEKFIFDNIEGRTLLLVPDQFSLQAESDAFFYLKKKSIMDLQVVDFSSLGRKAVHEVGGPVPDMIDKYGRHMLLAKIADELSEELTLYGKLTRKNSFIERANSVISELKRSNVTPQMLSETVETGNISGFLSYKLADIEKIYEKYQEAIAGKYIDSEDYVTFYGEKIEQSAMVRESAVWVYGFDTFTPKNIMIIGKLMKTARSVNVVMTYGEKSRFELTGYVMSRLRELAEEMSVECVTRRIEGETRDTVRTKAENWRGGEFPITLCAAAGANDEAERAAAYIVHLVRDEGYRYGDIVVVCNDMDERGGILRRILTHWGIPVFTDQKRRVMHHSAVGFILALMELVSAGYKTETVMQLLKSGVSGISTDDTELLENYTAQYRIRGTMWKKEFSKGSNFYEDEELEHIENARKLIVEMVESAKDAIGRRNTVAEKLSGFYTFLEETLSFRDRLDALMDEQEEGGMTEAAAETAQSWNVICNIFDQIVNTLGEQRIPNKDLQMLMQAGFESMEIGLVPTSADCVMIGTLQRTRLSRIRALIVMGANEGVIPMNIPDEGLLSDREKAVLESIDLEFSKRDAVVRREEEIAIYRTLSMPSERLYVSCNTLDENGETLRSAAIFREVRERVGGYKAHAREAGIDIDAANAEGDVSASAEITTKEGAIAKTASALESYAEGKDIDEKWLYIMRWLETNEPEMIRPLRDGLLFTGEDNIIGEKFAEALYRGDRAQLEVSASQLEKYSGCPFSYFIAYGIRPEELRSYEVGPREIGDIYHECLMRFSKALTLGVKTGVDITDDSSPWMQISRQECRAEIERILGDNMNGYREGLLTDRPQERYRAERITEICDAVAWTLVNQVRQGRIKAMHFERAFGNGCAIPAIRVKAGEKDVLIRGKIDRLDVMAGDKDSVRVIDYKTGGDSISLDHFRSGYKLQLMVYLRAALDAPGAQKAGLKPAGVFYFKIREFDESADKRGQISSRDSLRMADAYRLEGVMLGEDDIIESMDSDIEGSSHVLPVKKDKKGVYVASAGGALLSEDEFSELYEQVNGHVEHICHKITSGNIRAMPKRERKKTPDGGYKTACKYCDYKGICMFDTSFDACEYDNV